MFRLNALDSAILNTRFIWTLAQDGLGLASQAQLRDAQAHQRSVFNDTLIALIDTLYAMDDC